MGYKRIGENLSFADLAVFKSLEHNRGLKKNLIGNFSRNFGADFWVKMKKHGLKTGVKPGILEY